jgi:PAS domain S-box-containing protein
MKVDTLPEDSAGAKASVSTVLVVDSSVEDANALVRLIRQHPGSSIRVITATSILDAIREYRQERPDCVLVEHRLADGDGVELLRMLNDVTAPLPAPVIFLAGSDSPRLAVRVLKAGAMDFLSKSWIDSESLYRAIQGAVDRTNTSALRIQRRSAVEDANRNLQNRIVALQESDRFSRQISGRAPVFLYLNDLAEDHCVYANQTMLAALGYSETEMMGKETGVWRSLVHPQDLAVYSGQIKRLVESGDDERHDCEYRIRRKDGSYLRLTFRESVFSRFESGSVRQVVGTAEEVSETALLLHSLEEEKTHLDDQVRELQLVWDQRLFGLAVAVGAKPTEVKLNPVLADWLNLPESTDLGSLARAFGFTQNSSSFGKALNRGISSHRVERTIHREDGSALRLTETVHPLPDSKGDMAGFVAYFMPALDSADGGADVPDSSPQKTVVQPRFESEIRTLRAKLDASEKNAKELKDQLALSEEVAEKLQDLLDSQSASSDESESDGKALLDQALSRAQTAEQRLSELEARWRETVELLLSADENREKLASEIQSLQARHSEHTQILEERLLEDSRALKIAQEQVLDAAAENATLQAKVTSLQSASSERESGLDFPQDAALRAAREQVEAANLEIEKLGATIRSYEVTQVQNREAFDALSLERDRALSDAEGRLSESLRELAELRSFVERLGEKGTELADAAAIANHSATEIDSLKEELRISRGWIADLTASIESSGSLNAEALRVHDELKTELAKVTTQREQLDKKFSAATGEQERLTDIVSQLREDLSEGERQKAMLFESSRELETTHKRALDDLEEIRRAKNGLEAQTLELQESVRTLQDKVDRLGAGSEESAAKAVLAAQTLADLEDEKMRLARKLELAEAAVAGLSEKLSQSEAIASFQADQHSKLSTELNDRIKIEEQAVASVRDELATAQANLRDKETALAVAHAKSIAIEERARNLEEQLSAVQVKLHEGKERWWKTYRDAEPRDRERTDALKELEAVRERLNAADKAIALKTEELGEASRKLTEIDRSLSEERESKKDLESLLAGAKVEMNGLVAAKSEIERQLWAKLAEAETQLEETLEGLSAAQAERDTAVSKLDTIQGELRKQLTAAEVALTEKEDLLEATNKWLEDLQQTLTTTNAENETLEVFLKSLTEEHGAANESLARLRGEKEDLNTRMEAAEASCGSAKTEAANARLELQRLTRELNEEKAALGKSQEAIKLTEWERMDALDRYIETNAKLGKAQNDLRLADEKYRALASSLPCIVFTANTLGMVEYENERWHELTGIPVSQAQEGSWKQVVHGDDYNAFLKAWTGGMRSGQAFSLNVRIRRKDGIFRWHTLEAKPEMEDNRIRCWHGTLTEIHEQISAREAARQARLRYGALLDHTNESILFLSPGGHVLGASKASLALLRRGAEGVVGTPFWETPWWHKSEESKLHDAVKRASVGDRQEFEAIRIDHERQHRQSKVIVVPVQDENEQIAMLVSHFFDL